MKCKSNLNLNSFKTTVTEITQLIDYLDIMLNHASRLVGTFMNFDYDDNENIITDMTLNLEALDELAFNAKRISSKSDVLQNKVDALKKIINE